jgi:hypothetical protein
MSIMRRAASFTVEQPEVHRSMKPTLRCRLRLHNATLTPDETADRIVAEAAGRVLAPWKPERAELSVVGLTNTALEGCMGSFPAEVQASIYASLPPD